MKTKTVLGKRHKPSENWLALQEELKSSAPAEKASFKPRRPFKKRAKKSEEEASTSQDTPSAPTKALGNCLGLDCEYVGVGRAGEEDMLARASLVDESGAVVLDKYVRPTERVTDFRTQFSGIRPSLITQDAAETFESVQKQVSDLIQGKLVVGHALYNDFKVLRLSHPRSLVRDTARYEHFRKLAGGQKHPSLKNVARSVLGLEVQKGEHDSVADARIAMQLYQLHRRQWEQQRKSKKLRKK